MFIRTVHGDLIPVAFVLRILLRGQRYFAKLVDDARADYYGEEVEVPRSEIDRLTAPFFLPTCVGSA
jgi:hypothetical protein